MDAEETNFAGGVNKNTLTSSLAIPSIFEESNLHSIISLICHFNSFSFTTQIYISSFHFDYILDLMRQRFGYPQIFAFDYIDEDGDWITVRSDDETSDLFSQISGQQNKPLHLHARSSMEPADASRTQLNLDQAPSLDTPNNLQIGQTIGTDQESSAASETEKSTLLEPSHLAYLGIIGNGAFGVVCKYFDRAANRMMAVKILPLDPADLDSGAHKKRIMSELSILQQCRCPYIIEHYGTFADSDAVYACTEFMDGGSLERYVPVPREALVCVGHALIRGLHYLWSNRVLHRDIKPGNVLLSTGGAVKLCDFGVSKQLARSLASTYVGTAAYMAPERIRGEDYNASADVFSLGITLYELAAGTYPYKLTQKSVNFIMQAILTSVPPKLDSAAHDEQLVELVWHCMQPDRRSRPPPESLSTHVWIAGVSAATEEARRAVVAQWLERVSSSLGTSSEGH